MVVTSHVMSELEELADDVAFLLDGRIRFRGPLEALRARTGEERLERAVARLMRDPEDEAEAPGRPGADARSDAPGARPDAGRGLARTFATRGLSDRPGRVRRVAGSGGAS